MKSKLCEGEKERERGEGRGLKITETGRERERKIERISSYLPINPPPLVFVDL